MPQISPTDITNIILSVGAVLFYLYKRIVEPRLPANKLAMLSQIATIVVQRIEQQGSDLSPDRRKQLAVDDVKALLREFHAPVPSDEAISGAIESAVYVIGLMQPKAPQTISTQAARPPAGGNTYES
jgi:Phage holin protein (Holin_LLH).